MSQAGGPPDIISSPLLWGDDKVVTPTYTTNPLDLSTTTVKYQSYSGTDISAIFLVPDEQPMKVGELQTVSYSMHRENTPVRTLGHVNPIGFVRGPRTIAGSLIFTQFDRYAFYRLTQYRDLIVNSAVYSVADMLPPFDIILTFVNESGMFGHMRIYGVTILDEGGTMSVDDLVSEQTFTYIARGIQPLTAVKPFGFVPADDIDNPNFGNR